MQKLCSKNAKNEETISNEISARSLKLRAKKFLSYVQFLNAGDVYK